MCNAGAYIRKTAAAGTRSTSEWTGQAVGWAPGDEVEGQKRPCSLKKEPVAVEVVLTYMTYWWERDKGSESACKGWGRPLNGAFNRIGSTRWMMLLPNGARGGLSLSWGGCW
ncbi:hypothetical protein HZ326_13061, partial [Fusarium oxysporum f. sp. albedinis]